jgi:hypothetical protein
VVAIYGLDLGQAGDPTALCGAESSESGEPYRVRLLRRWELGTPYPRIVEDVTAELARPHARDATLVVDATGVGRPVVDLFREAGGFFRLVPVTVTAGQRAEQGPDGVWRVPKVILVSGAQVILQQRRVKIARSLPLAEVLVKELLDYRVRITVAANEVFGAWREGQHDDLLFALCLCLWAGENLCCGGWEVTVDEGSRSLVDQIPADVWMT